MRKRWIGYAVWLLLTACLYFFENNTGTRAILLCALLFPLVPSLRMALFTADEPPREEKRTPRTARRFRLLEEEEPGDVRPYQPGDPVRRIHWKLSARRDELLVRGTEREQNPFEAEQTVTAEASGRRKTPRSLPVRLCAGILACSVGSLILIPEARNSAMALCNGIFRASEAVNAYAYDPFPVPEGQSVLLAAALLAAALTALIALMILLRSKKMAMGLTGALTLFQVYFGLPFPAWANLSVYGLLALWMIRGPGGEKSLRRFIAAILLVTLFTALLAPGTDAGTEAASETVRDRLNRLAQRIAGEVSEQPEGETETRHVHTRSLQTGNGEARTDREYRLVMLEEEQISIPRFVNWLRTAFLFLLMVAVTVLPFAPFLLLNARKRKAREARRAFASEQVNEAVCAIFRQILTWLRETGVDGGNLLYREWADTLPEDMPEGYAARFGECAMDFEEAVYSDHDLPEEKRQLALALLKETETARFRTADWRQRLRIRYWVCLCE
ncbi:MAG: DUF58 domain-containing protein [Clostridia bacterium]|nr:DUF58 domain-containing protein [Clostridia bacterium]